MNAETGSRGPRATALVALAYLGVALFVLRGVLPNPTHLLPYNSAIDAQSQEMGHLDQSMVVSVIVRNAHTLWTQPWNLLGDGQCYPFPKSFTLGEHMFGEGLLLALPWAGTNDPILAYNLMLVLTLWIPGMAMFVLARHFTRDVHAAFLAGLFLQLAPNRIIDGGHPYLHAEFWLPLILLLLHRLFTGGSRWLCAAGIGLLFALEGLETIYVLLACALITGVYGLFLAVRFPRALPRIALPLGVGLVFALAVTWTVLGPYFETRRTWDVLAGRPTVLFELAQYGPGSPYFVGWLGLLLAAVGLLDRVRGSRAVNGDDPRLAFLAAALLILWASLGGVSIPGTDFVVPGLFALLGGILPGLDALRGLFAVNAGLWVPVAVLAGYGCLAVLERLSISARRLAIVSIAAAIVVERFFAPVATGTFGAPLTLAAWNARPAEEDIALVRSAVEGPVLDVPLPPPSNDFARMGLARNLLLHAWAPRPSSSCYNSFDTPLAAQIHQLSNALPDAGAAQALAALGFGTVLAEPEAFWRPHRLRWDRRWAEDPAARSAMPEVGASPGRRAYRLAPPAQVREDLGMLSGNAQGPPVELAPARRDPDALVVPFVFHNPGPETFRLSPPRTPRDGWLRWTRFGETDDALEPVRLLWPLALGPGNLLRIDVETRLALPPGTYRVELGAAEDPGRALATRDVIIPRRPEAST